ncbi:LysR substrate binding domain-containing protein [Pseudorhodoferax soli]|uniref:LysR substrate binding domain-containing protein n=2 Tax=Pseudorhodoferax soli TaxID=545864 RepID=A0A368XNP8_9BURK|nr:LysR substrate binding domain-containing protein [Pseudorhodoferax soli]
MAPIILTFLRRYHHVHVDLFTEGRLVDIVAAGFDMGLRPADLVPSDMVSLSLGLHRSNAVVPSPDFLRMARQAHRADRPVPLSLHSRPAS